MFIQRQFAPNPGKQECMLPLFKYTYSYISIPVKWDRGPYIRPYNTGTTDVPPNDAEIALIDYL